MLLSFNIFITKENLLLLAQVIHWVKSLYMEWNPIVKLGFRKTNS